MSEKLSLLSRWFASQCNGKWEHELGVTIETIDNPGWRVVIDLRGTALESKTLLPIEKMVDDSNWLTIAVADKKFVGVGDPTKLDEITSHFLRFSGMKQ